MLEWCLKEMGVLMGEGVLTVCARHCFVCFVLFLLMSNFCRVVICWIDLISLSGSRKERFFCKFEHDKITFPNNAGSPTSFINNRSSASPVNVYTGHRGWFRSGWGSGGCGLCSVLVLIWHPLLQADNMEGTGVCPALIHIKKQSCYFANKVCLVKVMVFPVVMYGCESWTIKKAELPKNRCFWTVVLEKTLESPLDCKEIQPVHPKRNQWIFIGRTDAEAEAPTLGPPDVKNWHIWKDPDAGKDWRQEKGTTEDKMVGWHHRRSGHEFE